MTVKHYFNLRQFTGTAAAVSGGISLPATDIFGTYRFASPDELPSTPYFWYFNPPDRPFVNLQNKIVTFFYSNFISV